MRSKWAVALGILGALVATPALASRNTAQYTSLTVFGDSLVDAGNFDIYKTTTTPDPVPAYFLPDSALGYFPGRFTNGYDYPDLLSMDLFGVPTTPSLAGGANFAFAGARIIDTQNDNIPDLGAQLNAFETSGRAVDPNGLYILNFGANDVFAAEGVLPVSGIGSYPNTSSYLQAAADQYVAGVQALNDLGVRNILMTDFPLAGDPLTIEANNDLSAALATLSLDPGTDLMVYSLSDFNLRVLTDPAAFGLPPQRLDTTCIAAGEQASGCAGIFSFDGIHPTAAIQAAGFNDMNQEFGLTSAIPEPTTWALMCVGFGAIGAAMRSRRRPIKAPAVGSCLQRV
jgi:phospholipase/lecithinase/hemolysin